MSTSASGAHDEAAAPKRTYAAPGAKKRPVAARGAGASKKAAGGAKGAAKGKGKGKAKAKAIEEEEDEGDEDDEVVAAPKKKKVKERKGGVELLLANKFDLDSKKKDPTGWWMSEKRASCSRSTLPSRCEAAVSSSADERDRDGPARLTSTILFLQSMVCARTGTASRPSGRVSATPSPPPRPSPRVRPPFPSSPLRAARASPTDAAPVARRPAAGPRARRRAVHGPQPLRRDERDRAQHELGALGRAALHGASASSLHLVSPSTYLKS